MIRYERQFERRGQTRGNEDNRRTKKILLRPKSPDEEFYKLEEGWYRLVRREVRDQLYRLDLTVISLCIKTGDYQ